MIRFGTSNEVTRRDWVKKALLAISKGKVVLDAGAGEGRYKKYCSHLRYISQDFGKYDGKGNLVGLQTGSWNQSQIDIISDIVAIPLKDRSVDAILCTEVFEHIPDPVAAIKEFSRLLKRGGKLILTAPFCSFTHFAPYFYFTGFSRYFYEKYLLEFGFKIEEISPNGDYFTYLGQELQRVQDIAEKYSSGKLSRVELEARDSVLRMLRRFSRKGRNLTDLLPFGYHVLAIRNEKRRID